jgi:hypothetical protein
LDLQGLQKQIEQKKKEILQGVNDGFKELGPILEGRMRVYMQDIVYNAYISASENPDKYDRTFDLLESIRSEVVGSTLYIWSGEGLDYASRVLLGHKEIPYDYPWVPPGSEGDFRQSRDWIEPTKMEIIEHFHQNGSLTNIMIEAIQKRVK